ncbi:MAG: MopE-related protein [Myxococcota bacterium]|nr:MopE-related protein [Myxococcota bacterium]
MSRSATRNLSLLLAAIAAGCAGEQPAPVAGSLSSAAHISHVPAWVVASGQASAALGLAVAGGGDLDGDGISDGVLGVPGLDAGQPSEGGVFVFSGDGTSFASTPSWSRTSDQAFAFLGAAVAIVGDLNDDGVDDLAVGAWQADGDEANEGRVEIFYGSSLGLPAEPNLTLLGGQEGASFGFSLAGGDINGDGIDDLLVGAPGWDGGEPAEGAVFWFEGSPSGLVSLPSGTLTLGSAGASFGYSLAVVGDVDLDGDDDLLVGAPTFADPEPEEGMVALFHGDPSGLLASAEWTAQSDQVFSRMGHSVAGAGDVNADGYSDLLVGTPWFDDLTFDRGRAELWLGGEDPPEALADWTWIGPQTGGLLAAALAGPGDLNGDGVDDLVVGATHGDQGIPGEGLIYVFPGVAGGVPGPLPGRVIGGAGILAQFGSALAPVGDANGDGFADLLVGGWNFTSSELGEGMAALLLGIPATVDLDMDGFCVGLGCVAGIPGGDCDDLDPDRYPGAPELCDGIDQNCDGVLPLDEQDGDGDGWMACLGDCNDNDVEIHPGAVEECDTIDHDCDGLPDNGVVPPSYWPDADGDGHGDPLGIPIQTCGIPQEGYVPSADDCDDDNASLNPSALEVTCNGVDEDCSFLTPDVPDRDGDAFTPCEDCQELGTNLQCGDCDDVDQEINPYMAETCSDGIDQDCDGIDPECALPPLCDEPDNICEELGCACSSGAARGLPPLLSLLGLLGLVGLHGLRRRR